MGLFVCEMCGTTENTALGHYWSRNFIGFKNKELNGKALCSECFPTEYEDGSQAGRMKWHNRFPKQKYDATKYDPKEFLNRITSVNCP